MSAMSAEEDPQTVARIVEQSLAFAGLILVPGLFGGALLGERILRIYGPEFPKGTTVLTILIVANLVMGYQTQFLNTLNAIDRPDLAFRVNLVFVGANIALNVGLIYLYGWTGAAVATTISVAISLVFAYRYTDDIINFDVPVREISKQWFAGVLMTGVVYGGLWVENTYGILGHNVAVVLILVTIGASVYFLTLLAISTEFRETVDRNAPVALPFVSR
jgi:O-antigen/teichoic acid export membrane protein